MRFLKFCLLLSLTARLQPAAREEGHRDPEGGRGGLGVPPPRLSQGHRLLVERRRTPEGQPEVWVFIVCASWRVLLGLADVVTFISISIYYASAQGDSEGGGSISTIAKHSFV